MDPDSPQPAAPTPEEVAPTSTPAPEPESDAPEETAPASDPVPESAAEELSPEQSTDKTQPVSIQESAPQPISQPIPQSAPPSVITPPAPVSVAPAWDPHSPEEIQYMKNVVQPMSIVTRRKERDERIEKLMAFAKEKGSVDNVAVRLHLRVSTVTATRYLTALVHQGRLTRKRHNNDVIYTVV